MKIYLNIVQASCQYSQAITVDKVKKTIELKYNLGSIKSRVRSIKENLGSIKSSLIVNIVTYNIYKK